MAVGSIVDQYVATLMREAVYEEIDGGVGGTLPQFFGVVGIGEDRENCELDLRDLLDQSIFSLLRRGYDIPVVQGIDLNTAPMRALAALQELEADPSDGEIYSDEREFDAALTALTKPLDGPIQGSS